MCLIYIYVYMGFPGSSAGKKSACNAGDPGSIPGSGRFPGEGLGYPLQYSWASLVAHDAGITVINEDDVERRLRVARLFSHPPTCE